MDADASGDTSRLCADTYMDDDFCLEDEFGALPPPLGSWLCWSVGPSVGMEPSYKATADPGVCFDQGHHNLNRSKRFEKSSEKHDAFLTGSTILRDRHEKGVSGATEAYMVSLCDRPLRVHQMLLLIPPFVGGNAVRKLLQVAAASGTSQRTGTRC
eukprot:GHVS01024142.1.p1 GENE.GHVS01024142.1~~GHVS01024142.1.p1  ORF type:complete len:156 (-),score=15.07 GHVS01024142.1:2349-2816(-)